MKWKGMEVPGGEVIWDFPRVKFVLKCYLHSVAGKRHRTESSNFRINAGDAPNEEVGGCKVEQGRENQRCDR